MSYTNYYDQPTFNSPYYFNGYSQSSLPQSNADSSLIQPVFKLKLLQGTRICSCYGCGSAIRTDTSYVPPPPHDIVINFKERRYYKDPTTQEMRLTKSDENTYYHMMRKCVLYKHPSFEKSMISIPEDVHSQLQDIHRTHITEKFGLPV